MVAEKSKHKALRSVTRTGEIRKNYVISKQPKSDQQLSSNSSNNKNNAQKQQSNTMKKIHETTQHRKSIKKCRKNGIYFNTLLLFSGQWII